MNSLKQKLYRECLTYVQQLIKTAEEGIRETQEASNDETKSSAGDKYETSREMMQQETTRHAKQLDEANKLRVALKAINPVETVTVASPGSVIFTNNGNFFLAISAGLLKVDEVNFYAVSPASPIGAQFLRKKTGDQFSLNGKTYEILKIE